LDWLDRWVERHEQIRPIGRGGYIMRMKKARYRGPGFVLTDGTAVNSGDPIGELHLDNQRAAALHLEGNGGFRFRQEIYRLLPAIALDLCTCPEYREINAVYGVSLFWRSTALMSKTGFEQRPLSPFTRWWLGTWERILLASYHPQGQRRLRKGRRTETRQVWITRRTLLRSLERPVGPLKGEGASAAGTGSDGHAADP
jgi:YkoP-like protein